CRDSGPKWKRELVQDHKFDFVDIDEFYDDSCFTRTKYSLSTLLIIKSVLVYMADLWTAISLLVIGTMTITPVISIQIAKWIFLGCIVMSFLLLFLDIRKSRLIIESRDISYAFTSVIASRYYTTKSYPHYCFFQKINDSKKTTDEFAFFVFFTLKGGFEKVGYPYSMCQNHRIRNQEIPREHCIGEAFQREAGQRGDVTQHTFICVCNAS
ncbi:hypothetical protein BC937DRAFT_87944, partial [Endogone sp. FLAS-F59071]